MTNSEKSENREREMQSRAGREREIARKRERESRKKGQSLDARDSEDGEQFGRMARRSRCG